MDLYRYGFKYKLIRSRHPDTGEIIERYYPILPCRISRGTNRTPFIDGLLDSGSDGLVIPLSLARSLKLPFSDAPPMQTASGGDVKRFTSRVDLTIGRGGRYSGPFKGVEVSIPSEGNPPVLIGRDPVFTRYKITFIEAELRYLMEPYERGKS
jgi:hypothetical protein